MNLKRELSKSIRMGTAIWFIFFLIDYSIHLFRIHGNGTINTYVGVIAKTKITSTELSFEFTLASYAIWAYIVFIVVYCTTIILLQKKRTLKEKR